MKRSRATCLYLGLSWIWLSGSGCTTVRGPFSGKEAETESGEVVVLAMVSPREYPEDFVSLPRGVLADLAMDAVVKAGEYLLSREADLVGGAYAAVHMEPQGVRLTPKDLGTGGDFLFRDLEKTVIFERYVDNKRLMSLVLDFVPFSPPNSTKSYFQIRPRSLRCDKSVAQTSRTILGRITHFDTIDFTVRITVAFPDSRQPNGISEYQHVFEVKNYEIGDMRVLREEHPLLYQSHYFEIPSEGPVTVKVEAVESNPLDKGLRLAADALKGN